MSAIMVDPKHIATLVTCACDVGISWERAGVVPHPSMYAKGEPWGPDAMNGFRLTRWVAKWEADAPNHAGPDHIGAMLVAENQRSVNWRYDLDELEPFYLHPRGLGDFANKPLHVGCGFYVHVLKVIAHYEYQSCEHPQWHTSEARDFCAELRAVMCCFVPGYEDAVL